MPDSSVGRRGVLASAAALAGLVGLEAIFSLVAAPAAAPSENRKNAAPNYHGSPPVFVPMIIEGGTLVDPATGEATEDAVVVPDRRKDLAAGKSRCDLPAVRSVAATARRIDAGGRFILPGLVDAHLHTNTLEDARLVLSHGASTVRSGSSSFYQDIALGSAPRMGAGAGTAHAFGWVVRLPAAW